MKQKAKISLYGILAVLAFALVLAACPDKPAEPAPDTSKLKLSGQVFEYIEATDPSSILSGPKEFKGKLEISDGGLGGSGEIRNGKLTYSIDVEPPLSPINEGMGLDYLKGMYKSLKFSPENVNAAVVALEITNNDEYSGLLRSLMGLDLSKLPTTIIITVETVNYVYVDKDMNITADKDTFEYDYSDFPIILTSEKINLNLKKGWNALYSEITAQANISMEVILSLLGDSDPDLSTLDLSALEPKGHLKMSVGDPNTLKWTLIPSQSEDTVEPQPPQPPDFE